MTDCTQTIKGKWDIVTTYAYDDENRLIEIKIEKGHKIKEVSFTYDPLGRRISKTVGRADFEDEDEDEEDVEGDDKGKGKRKDNDKDKGKHGKPFQPRTTYYVYDDQNIIAEYDENSKLIASYVHGPNIDEPLSAEIRRDWIYYHADGLGSITTLTSHMGHVVQKYEYDSFGNMSLKPHFIKQHFTYTGREFDIETGLYYYRARYYDAKIGRFITRDPIGFDGGDVNLYVYVGNNPVNRVDPLGLDWIYDRGTKTLQQINSRGEVTSCWPAISGPWGNGELPPGSYTLKGSPVSVPPSHPRQSSYCDALGNCWWQPITPNFPTDRTGLGIHPDGNRPGTAGCIGTTDCDTSSLRDALTNDQGPLIVR